MFSTKQISVAYLLIIALLYAASFFLPEDTSMAAILKIADPAATTLDYFKEVVQLATALNTALLAAAASIAIKGQDWSTTWGKTDAVLLILVFIGVCVSYYGIYLGHIETLSMVLLGYFNPFAIRMQLSLKLEYYGLLFGVVILGLLFARMLAGRKDGTPVTSGGSGVEGGR
jgi:hypothetical protein